MPDECTVFADLLHFAVLGIDVLMVLINCIDDFGGPHAIGIDSDLPQVKIRNSAKLTL
jgi:hypothetical protein